MPIGDDTHTHARRPARLVARRGPARRADRPARPRRRRRRPGPAVRARPARGRARPAAGPQGRALERARRLQRPGRPARRRGRGAAQPRGDRRRPSCAGSRRASTARRTGSSGSTQQLRRSLNVLRNRLVGIYRSGEPDLLTVMLESDGFDDLVSRYEYLRRIEEQDSVDRRPRARRCATAPGVTVERVDRGPQRDRGEEGRARAHPDAARGARGRARRGPRPARRRRSTRSTPTSSSSRATSPTSRTRSSSRSRRRARPRASRRCRPGPIQGASGGWIWPVNGTLTSPFGYRWGRMHEGIDIAVPEGTPIRAAKAGQRDPRRLHRRLRQLHLRRPRRRALLLLRAPVELRDQPRRLGRPGRGDRLRGYTGSLASAPTCTSRSASTAPPSTRSATCSVGTRTNCRRSAPWARSRWTPF